jgi:hypothetical protein
VTFHMWTAPSSQGVCRALIRSLSPYVRPVCALAQERWPRWCRGIATPPTVSPQSRGWRNVAVKWPLSAQQRRRHPRSLGPELAHAGHSLGGPRERAGNATQRVEHVFDIWTAIPPFSSSSRSNL